MPHRIVPTPAVPESQLQPPPNKKLKYHHTKKSAQRKFQERNFSPSAFGIISDSDLHLSSGGDELNRRTSSKHLQVEISNSGLAPATPTLDTLQLQNVKDMYFHPQISQKSTDQALEKSLSTCRKNQTALNSVLSFLDPLSASWTTDQSSIFERFLFGSTPHVNSFASTTFSFSDLKDTQYLHIRGSPPPSPLSSYKFISVITSICLFSADVVSSLSSKLIDLYTHNPSSAFFDLHHTLTFNELDSISRLSNTIADIICSISCSPRSSLPLNINIILDIPQIQYYLSGPTSHFHIPAISRTWLSLIDTRKASIERIFERCIIQEINRRVPAEKMELSGVSYSITNTSSLNPLLPLLNTKINDFPYISIQPCINTLRSADKAWGQFLDSLPLPGLQPPDTLEELVFISYVYEILLPFLRTLGTEGTVDKMENTLIIQIDNIVESKPYLKAKKFLEVYNKKLGAKKASLIGIYPSERIFYSKEGSYRSSLHKYDPGQDISLGPRNIRPLEVLEKVYGVEAVAAVAESAAEEELV
ncbi:hypothetical protein TWF481_006329 [Arthrobotrys musiformis]|uniref:Uncharacterized protein n=1 Tax=Arthrobotrys musiformis TaxID=47236 RepID=A0AAV9WGJ9_9PEZI